jgi:xanthine dehydrogenase large subunit
VNKQLPILSLLPSHPHDSAHLHVTGESLYVDDQPLYKNELFVGLVFSPHAKAQIIRLDVQKALAVPGVVASFNASDLHHNRWGSTFLDQPFIAETEVNYVGEVIAVLAAKSPEALRLGLKEVEVLYEKGTPILTIADAIARRSFIGDERSIKRGNVPEALSSSPHQLTGEIVLKGAEHFYLENQSARALPQDDGGMVVHVSTQHPTETQALVAEALGLPLGAVVCVTKRLGGGFGGKETQAAPFAVYTAVVAHKLKRPARLVLSKDDDMIMTGKRNPYQARYHVGFDDQGQLLALACELYGDAGAYADLSTAILDRAMAHVDNAYFLPHVHIRGVVCRTNFHPHTAFRGFGGPKGVALIEHILEEIGHHVGRDAVEVRKLNCYQQDRNITPYGQVVENNL